VTTELTQKSAPSATIVYSLMALISLIWGSTWLVIRLGLFHLPPFFSAGVRFVVAGLVMALLAPWLARREGGGRPPFSVILAQAFCQFVVNYALVYYAETVLSSGLVCVLWAIFPMLVALTGHFVTRTERLQGRQWLGMLIGFGGVVVLFVTDIAETSERAWRVGALLLLAPLAVTISTTLIKLRATGASSVLLNRDSMLIGGVTLLLLSFATERGEPMRFTAAAVFTVLYLALAGTVVTFGAFLWLLRTVPAYRLSLWNYVTPVLALWLGALTLGEYVGPTTLAGTALVIVGVGLTLRSTKAASHERAPVSSPEAG
jgi:drug/metabolite transporter (DMT)-like permease